MINTVTKIYDEGKLQCYKVTYANSNVSRSVPLVEDNTDYQAIQEWAAIDGNNIIDNGA
tara:strand:- start:169 stop:345 length:177 start_codon:yes stop_codon:yes gene_type:complete